MTSDASPGIVELNHIEMKPLRQRNRTPKTSSARVPDLSTIENKIDKLELKMDEIDRKFSDMMSRILPFIKRMTQETAARNRLTEDVEC